MAKRLRMMGGFPGPSDEQVKTAVSEYLEENPPSSGGTTSDAEQLAMLIEADMLPAVHDADGKILTDESGRIALRY